MWNIRLYGGEQGPVRSDETVGHTGSVKGEAGIPVAVEENEPTGGVWAFAQEMDGFARGDIGSGEIAGRGPRGINKNLGAAKKINSAVSQHHFIRGGCGALAGDAAGVR